MICAFPNKWWTLVSLSSDWNEQIKINILISILLCKPVNNKSVSRMSNPFGMHVVKLDPVRDGSYESRAAKVFICPNTKSMNTM